MSAPLIPVDDVFARARAVSCRDVAENLCGAVLRGGGSKGWARAKRCPLCEGKNDFSVCAGGFRCHKCGQKGDGIALWAEFAGCRSKLEAAAHIAGVRMEEIATREAFDRVAADKRREDAARRAAAQRTRIACEPDDYETAQIARASSLWLRARPAAGTIVERYLVHRAIPHGLAAKAALRLRLLACAPWWDPEVEDNDRREPDRVTPAMLALVETPGGGTGGVHLTHLAEDGRGKADLRPAKKMHGPQGDGAGRAGGVLLIPPPTPAATLVAGEGIETALSAAALLRAQHPKVEIGVFATLSLDRLQGGMGRGPWGGVDWRSPFPDPDQPAATWPHAGPVVIAVDHDMRLLVLQPGTKWETEISTTRRAQVCGLLASHWWKAAGASDVRVLTPPVGMDANDLLRARARAAAETAAA